MVVVDVEDESNGRRVQRVKRASASQVMSPQLVSVLLFSIHEPHGPQLMIKAINA